MNLLEKNKSSLVVKLIFILFFIHGCLQTGVQEANANEITLDNSDDAFSGRIFWPEFMQNCGDDNYMDTGGELHDIQAEIIFNFETGKITGTVSAKQIDERFPFTYKEDSSVHAIINGVMERKNDYGSANYWQWVFTGEVDFTIHYHMEHKCNDDTGGYWETEDQTLTKKGVLSGITWGDTWTLDLRWEDQETRDGRTRYVQLSPDYTVSHFVFPKPIDLEVSISVASDVDFDSDPEPFTLTVEGRDNNMIDHFGWYFAYWEPDLELYWGLQNEQRFETSGTNTLQVTEAMREEWRRLAREYGIEDGSEIELQLNLRTFDENGYDLIENLSFEYTYTDISGDSSGLTPEDTSPPDTVTPPPEVVPSSYFGGMTGTLLTVGGVALGGYGLFRILRKPGTKSETKIETPSKKKGSWDDSIKLAADSEIKQELYEDSIEDSLSLEHGKLSGVIDSSNLSLDEGEDKISILQDSRVDLDLESLSIENSINLEDQTLSIEGNVESQGGTLDSLEISVGSQIETEINEFQIDPESNLVPSSFDGSVESGSISVDNIEMTIESGSQVKVDVDPIELLKPDIGVVTKLTLEGDHASEVLDKSNELNGNVRLNIGIQFEDPDSFATGSDSQIDTEIVEKSGEKKLNRQAQDNDNNNDSDNEK